MGVEMGYRCTCERCGVRKFFLENDRDSMVNTFDTVYGPSGDIYLCANCAKAYNSMVKNFMDEKK